MANHAYFCWKLIWFAFELALKYSYSFQILLEIGLICFWTFSWEQLHFLFFDENLFNLPSNLPWNSIWSWHLLGEQILPKKLHVVQNETFTEECLWLFLCLWIYLNITTESELYMFVFSWEKILLIKIHNEHDKIMY